MGLILCPELSLDLKLSYNLETINGFLGKVSILSDKSERLDKVDEFVKRLEDELKKIEVFKRELPLCMLILKDAMLYLKQETIEYKTMNDNQPILEEFVPMKKDSSCGENTQMDITTDEEESGRDKKNWMSSVQLWIDDLPTKNGESHTSSNRNENQSQNLVLEAQKGDGKRNQFLGGDEYDDYDPCKGKARKGFVPLVHSCPTTSLDARRKGDKEDASVQGLNSLVPGLVKHPEEKSISKVCNPKIVGDKISNSSFPTSNGRPSNQQASSRKQRRCWSPELHRRFVDALTQLGGAQVATPKQIRELMRVDGLTNDEVKSHLQKYRLHSRRVTNDQLSESSKPSSSESGSPVGAHQFPGLTDGTTTTGGVSIEDEDDEQSESYSWKG